MVSGSSLQGAQDHSLASCDICKAILVPMSLLRLITHLSFPTMPGLGPQNFLKVREWTASHCGPGKELGRGVRNRNVWSPRQSFLSQRPLWAAALDHLDLILLWDAGTA